MIVHCPIWRYRGRIPHDACFNLFGYFIVHTAIVLTAFLEKLDKRVWRNISHQKTCARAED